MVNAVLGILRWKSILEVLGKQGKMADYITLYSEVYKVSLVAATIYYSETYYTEI